ncbi:hypothetical protein CVD28_02555 [Bacillus sp. M6-12]|uniref:hypothetical protein n=1 Tax=Bacillus sp. M6-12 TaxID=2054166 RepID=UPI000C7683AF|nr:hypothetical protein [Bacillus sp. M6-12]PLS19313.1 hypothetical protein CVD28_02555 [Bacillus sp. M6-12]
MVEKMDLEVLGRLMIEHGLVIRAIPMEETSVYEVYHKDKYPDGVVYYDERRKREMIRVTKKLSKGGKFIITKVNGQGTIVNNWGKPVIFYDTIEEAVKSIIE